MRRREMLDYDESQTSVRGKSLQQLAEWLEAAG
jgi:hypothetical protein